MTTKTTNLGLQIVDFDTVPWHDATNDNWRAIDTAVYAATGVTGLSGVWTNNTAVVVGQKFIDPDDLTLWAVQVNHTTPVTGSFSDARIANPSYWSSVGAGYHARGEWAAGILYSAGDLAYDSSEILYCVCNITHTSTGTSLRGEIADWTILLDGAAIPGSSDVSYGMAQALSASQKKQAKDNIKAAIPKRTTYTANGTHTFDADCRAFQIEAVGSGGGAGGVIASSGNYGGSGGGNAGFYGKTDILAIGAITTATVVIGAAGVGHIADGTDGGDVSWTDGVHNFVWPGGKGSPGQTAGPDGKIGWPSQGSNSIPTGAIIGFAGLGNPASVGQIANTGPYVSGGAGGSNPLGTGGRNNLAYSSSNGNAGLDADGYGAGGGGATTSNESTSRSGGNGTKGILIVTEYF